MAKQELQNQILDGNKSLFVLVSAIPKLPDSETKGELIYKHDKLLKRLNELHINLEQIDNTCCYFGFINKCPGGLCGECKYYEDSGNNIS